MWLHRYAKLVSAATVLLIVAGGLVTSTGSGLCRSRLAHQLRLEHVHVPHEAHGGRHLLRARPPAHRERRRVSHDRPRVLDLEGRTAALDAHARIHGARRRLPAGTAGRHHRALFPADGGVDRARRARADLLLPDGRDRALHLARLDGAGVRSPVDDRMLRLVATHDDGVSSISRSSSAPRCGTRMPGLAIPDFPLVFGGCFRPQWTPQIAIHYAHRVGALIVTLAIAATVGHVWYHHAAARQSFAGRRCCSRAWSSPR